MLVYTVADYTSALHSEPYDCSVGHVCAPPWRSKVVLHRWWVMYLLLRGGAKGCCTTGGSCTCSTLVGHVPAPPILITSKGLLYQLHQMRWVTYLLHQSMVDHRPAHHQFLCLASPGTWAICRIYVIAHLCTYLLNTFWYTHLAANNSHMNSSGLIQNYLSSTLQNPASLSFTKFSHHTAVILSNHSRIMSCM